MKIKITELTPKQEKQLPAFIEKWVNVAKKPMEDGIGWVKKIYKAMGEKEPIVIIGQSPFATAMMASMFFVAYKADDDCSQVHNQLCSQLHNQLCIQLHNQLCSQLDSQLDSQLRSQLYRQLYNQLDSQLDSQVHNQLCIQLRIQLHSQLYNQLRIQLHSQLYNQLRSQLYRQLHSLNDDWYLGLWWLTGCGWYDFGKYIGVKYSEDVYDLFIGYNSNVHFIIPYRNIAFISEKPTQVLWDKGRLHCDGGQSVSYADGWGVYSLNGVSVPQWLAETRDIDIEPEKIIEIHNAQQRVEFIKKVGLERIKAKCCEKEIDAKTITMTTPINPKWPCQYKLLRLNYGNNITRNVLEMPNPSLPDTWHVEYVPSECRTIEQAMNFRLRRNEGDIDEENGIDWELHGDRVLVPPAAVQKTGNDNIKYIRKVKRWPRIIA